MQPPRLPEMLELFVKSQVDVVLAGEPADLAELGMRLLNRISPPNWTLEWSLPGWLGSALGLSAPIVAALTLANVYGLAYIRLQDDQVDGEVVEDDQQVAPLLATVLYQKWLLVYTGIFMGESPFWGFFEKYMAQWVAATLRSRRALNKAFRDYDAADLRGLGERGAPLKLCAVAACLLAQREELILKLESALDHLLTGAVLLDHALDWSGDLAAGRYNAFVAYASATTQTSENAVANRRAVLQELLVGRAARPYFGVLRRQLQVAIDESRAVGVLRLTDYVTWLQAQADAYGKRLAQGGRAGLHDLVGQALSPVWTPGVPAIS
jgi:hypothetical protein